MSMAKLKHERRTIERNMAVERQEVIAEKAFQDFKRLMVLACGLRRIDVSNRMLWGDIQIERAGQPKVEYYHDSVARGWLKEHLGYDDNKFIPGYRYALYVFDFPIPVSGYVPDGRYSGSKGQDWGNVYAYYQHIHKLIIKLLRRSATKDDLDAFVNYHFSQEHIQRMLDLIQSIKRQLKPIGGFGKRLNAATVHKTGVFHYVYAFNLHGSEKDDMTVHHDDLKMLRDQ